MQLSFLLALFLLFNVAGAIGEAVLVVGGADRAAVHVAARHAVVETNAAVTFDLLR